MLERADRVIALSEFQKRIFVQNGFSSDKIQVLHHGLEVDGLKSTAAQQREFIRIIYIGSLVYHKGPHLLIEALARRPDLNICLDLYGDASGTDPYLESLKRLAASDSRVRLLGTFPPGEMGRVLDTADALAMPVLWFENEPLVVKAARYVGLPVLASDIGTLSDSIRQDSGWPPPPGDVNARAGALESSASVWPPFIN